MFNGFDDTGRALRSWSVHMQITDIRNTIFDVSVCIFLESTLFGFVVNISGCVFVEKKKFFLDETACWAYIPFFTVKQSLT